MAAGASDHYWSWERVRVAFFAAAALAETLLAADDDDTLLSNTILFGSLFVLDMGLRVVSAGHPEAPLCWPADRVLLALLVIERWAQRPWEETQLVEMCSKRVRGHLLGRAIANPRRAVRVFRVTMRYIRWLAWILPQAARLLKIKKALGRWLVLRRQRFERAKRLRTLRRLRRTPCR